MNFTTQSTFKNLPSHSETNNSDTITVPGEAYTIRELLEKHTQGIYPQIAKEPQYEENPDFENIDITKNPDFDLTDASEMKQSMLQKLEEQEQKLATEAEEKRAQENAKIEELENEVKELRKQANSAQFPHAEK